MTETIGVSIGKWMACILHSVSLAGEVTNMEVAEKHIVKLRIQDEAYWSSQVCVSVYTYLARYTHAWAS